MSHAVILKSLRSPIGKFQGALASQAAPDLAAQVVKALLAAAPGVQPTEAIFGNVVGAGVGQAPLAQHVALIPGVAALREEAQRGDAERAGGRSRVGHSWRCS